MSRPSRPVVLAVLGALVVGGLVGWLRSAGSGVDRRSAQSPATATATATATSTNARTSTSTTPSPERTSRRESGSPATTAAAEGGPSSAGAGAVSGGAVSCPAATVPVRDASSLVTALAAARPGTVIGLADGVYTGKFVTIRSGIASAPIWLCGGPGAVLDGGSVRGGYVLHLQAAKYWRLIGFSVRDGQKGVVVDGSTGTVIQALTVFQIGDEAIHLRSATTYTVVRDSTISATGLRSRKFGEGIYVGSAKSNWCTYTACGPDRSNYNSIIANHISATSAESIDIKEGTQNGVILDNSFDGTNGLTGADSWVDIKGNNWLIAGNTGHSSPTDGFQVHQILSGWGTGNVFRSNTADVNGTGYGIHLAPIQNNTVDCNNRAIHAADGLTNATCV